MEVLDIKREYKGENRIEVSDEDLDKAKEELFAFYGSIDFKGDVQSKVDSIIETCLYGWYRCPSDFDKRIKSKIGTNSKFLKGVSNLTDETVKLGNNSQSRNNILDFIDIELSREERKFLKEREQEYRRDYEFNNSSDLILLNEVLIDELILNRLQKERIVNKDFNVIEARIEKVQKRVLAKMEKLGILRSQRIEHDNNVEGNVSQLSVMVEKKLDEIRKLKNKEFRTSKLKELKEKFGELDEEEFELLYKECILQHKHDLEPQINVIPEAEMEKVMRDLTKRE